MLLKVSNSEMKIAAVILVVFFAVILLNVADRWLEKCPFPSQSIIFSIITSLNEDAIYAYNLCLFIVASLNINRCLATIMAQKVSFVKVIMDK